MTHASAYPGLDGPVFRGFLGRAGGQPAGPDFSYVSDGAATLWGAQALGRLIPSGIDPALVYFELVETADVSSDTNGLAVVNG